MDLSTAIPILKVINHFMNIVIMKHLLSCSWEKVYSAFFKAEGRFKRFFLKVRHEDLVFCFSILMTSPSAASDLVTHFLI